MRLHSRYSLVRALGPLLLCLPLVAAEDDCDVTIRLVDGSDEEEVDGDEPAENVDSDQDGLSDAEEQELGTDPENPDSDFDGIIDSADEDTWNPCWDEGCNAECSMDEECGQGAWCVDGRCQWAEGEDSDQDGLSDADEQAFGTDPYNPDSDFDALSDFDELVNFGTDPLNPDTDYDGIPDAEDPDSRPPSEQDSDGDGLSDENEQYLGTDPFNADTDGDGLADLDELNAQTDPTNADSDGDGVVDSQDPEPFIDTDQDSLSDYLEGLVGTDPFNADTDGDGVGDGEELYERGTDPLNPDQGEPQCGEDADCGQGAVCIDGQCQENRQP